MSETEATEQDDVEQDAVEDDQPRRPSRSDRRRSRRHARAEAEKKRTFRRMFPNLMLSAFIFFLIAIILTDRPVPMPAWVDAELEERVNARFDEEAVRVGKTAVSLGPANGPQVRLRDVEIGMPGGAGVAVLNTMTASLVPGALVQGKVRPVSVSLDGAQVTLRRSVTGQFLFESDAGNVQNLAVAELLSQLDRALSDDTFASIQDVTAQDVVLTVEDARSGRVWQATGANIILRRVSDGLTLSFTSDVFSGTDDIAEVQLSFDYSSLTGDTALGVRVNNIAAKDIAVQSPVLAWLGVLDAPLSGAVRAQYDGSSGLTSLAGTLDIAAGALSPVEGADPQPFDAARAYFNYDPEHERLDFSEISVTSDALSVEAAGHTYLTELESGWPSAFLGQFQVSAVRFAEDGLFENAVTLTDVVADLRLRLDPFTLDFGQVTAPNDGYPVQAKAHIEARSDGWSVSVDAETAAIKPDAVLAFWPLIEARGTRNWLSQNVRGGTLTNVTAGVRKPVGQRPTMALNFDIEDGDVQFLPSMPAITSGKGRGTIADDQFTLVLDEGVLNVPGGGVIDGAGSTLVVPDIDEKPARGVFDIRAQGDATDIFRVLDNPPVRLIDRLDYGMDIATGEATVAARLELPLVKDLPIEDVAYDVRAQIRDAASTQIIASREITSSNLALAVDPDRISLSGPVEIDGVPITLNWSQDVSDGTDGASRATGQVRLSQATLDAFDVPIPPDVFSGSATANFTLDLPVNAAPRLSLTSDLRGAALSIGGLGWSKGRGAAAPFSLDAVLTDIPEIRGFSLDAPGLDLAGAASVGASGDLGVMTLNTFRIGNWLDGSAEIRFGSGAPRLAITGGRLDLRNLPSFGASTSSGGSVDVALDQLVVSDSIRLGPFRGELESGRLGLAGDFQGRLNGGSVVRASLAPTPTGTGIRIQSNNAGATLRDARLTPNARDGTMEIVLAPVRDGPDGTYNGQFLIENVRLRDAPVMAALLDAASVVGLLNQLGGPGIAFSTIDGQFRLTRSRLTIRDVAATGASIGISANGIYDFSAEKLDVEGVVSPFYFLNGVGQLVSRRGEGLFGVNYRVSGDTSRPRVSVNPLSLFTPGAFRQIFRRPPPTE